MIRSSSLAALIRLNRTGARGSFQCARSGPSISSRRPEQADQGARGADIIPQATA